MALLFDTGASSRNDFLQPDIAVIKSRLIINLIFINAVFECVDIIQRRSEFEERNKNPLRKITAEVLRNVEDERIDDTIDAG